MHEKLLDSDVIFFILLAICSAAEFGLLTFYHFNFAEISTLHLCIRVFTSKMGQEIFLQSNEITLFEKKKTDKKKSSCGRLVFKHCLCTEHFVHAFRVCSGPVGGRKGENPTRREA